MSPEQMRDKILHAYGNPPSERWRARVAKMSDKQVLAIYTRMMNYKELR